jgi:hypothetical protein
MKYTMSDARVFTSYLPNCELNSVLQKQYNTKDLHAYRYFLQQNADKVMKDTRIGTDECKFCPVCEASLSYRPNTDILAQQSKQ